MTVGREPVLKPVPLADLRPTQMTIGFGEVAGFLGGIALRDEFIYLRIAERAIELGYDDREWMQQDPDLEGLRNHPSFQKLLAKLQPQS